MKFHPPTRTADAPASRLPESIRRLWIACLEGAITDYRLLGSVQPIRSPNGANPPLERAWIVSPETRVGSFRWVCKLLELNPDYIRRGILDGPSDPFVHSTQVRQTSQMGAAASRSTRDRRE